MKRDLFEFSGKESKSLVRNKKGNEVAIVGMALNVPGADNLSDFWELLANGNDLVSDFPDSRAHSIFEYFNFIDSQFDPDNLKLKRGAYLEEIDRFDYKFFKLNQREAANMSPDQRLFLQTAWQALDDSGNDIEKLRGSRTGVFLGHTGTSTNYYDLVCKVDPTNAPIALTGNVSSIIASRISYILDFKGPSILVDTACSSSMVAMHYALQSIKTGDCDQALVGAVNLNLAPIEEKVDHLDFVSTTDSTRSFDYSSDGTLEGEGVIAIFIKKLDLAIRDKDRIYAVIKGSAINQDGTSVGIAAPNAIAQRDVLIDAWSNAGVDPETISYIEAHGAATKLGDPIEVDGITQAFENFTKKKQFCGIGSIKSNLGHLDAAAGIAGILKLSLSFYLKKLPPSIHFDRPNPSIRFERSPLYVNANLSEWNEPSPLRGGVSSFGISGTNCHLVLEEFLQEDQSKKEGDVNLFLLSANDENGLRRQIDFILESVNVTNEEFDDFCLSYLNQKVHLSTRVAIKCQDFEDLKNKLIQFKDGIENASILFTGKDLILDNKSTKLEKWVEVGIKWCGGASIKELIPEEIYPSKHLVKPYRFDNSRCWFEIPKQVTHPESVKENEVSTSTIEDELKGFILSAFEINEDDFQPEISFFHLGIDSISIIQLRHFLSKKYGLTVPADKLFEELSNVQVLSEFIRQNLVNGTSSLVETKNLSGARLPSFTAVKTKKEVMVPSWEKPRIEQHIESLIKRFNEKTKKSKQHTQKYRMAFANYRNVAGYYPKFKDLFYPITSDKAKGSRIYDLDGNEFLDFGMGFGVFLLGYNPSVITKALHQQVESGIFLGPISAMSGRVSQLITELTNVDRVAFFNSGTEACMVALRLARAYSGKSKVVKFNGAFHGTSDQMLAQNDPVNPLGSVPMSSGVPSSMIEDTIVLDYVSDDSLKTIEDLAPQLGAVIVEPVQSRDPGLQPKDFLQKLRKITEKHSIPLIFDEIITGFRSCPGGAQQEFDIQADLVTYGKVVAGGQPIGIVAGKEEFMLGIDGGYWSYNDNSNPIFDHRRAVVAGTFCNHPLTMASALAFLEYINENKETLYPELNSKTDRLANELNAFFQEYEVPIKIANFGSQFRLESTVDLSLLLYELLDRGIFVWEGMTFFVSEAHTLEDIDRFILCVKEACQVLLNIGYFDRDSKTSKEENRQLVPIEEQDQYGLTHGQKRLWVLDKIYDQFNAYNLQGCNRIKGNLDPELFGKAVHIVIDRHEILRTVFVEIDQEPRQKILSKDKLNYCTKYFDGTTEPYDLNELLVEQFGYMDLKSGPLLRVLLIKVKEDEYIFSFVVHHIISDGWSIELLLKEITEIYYSLLSGKSGENTSLEIHYKDYSAWQNESLKGENFNTKKGYWHKKLAHVNERLELPHDFDRPQNRSFKGRTIQFLLDEKITTELQNVASQYDASLYMVLLSALKILVYEYCGEGEVAFGNPISLRDDEILTDQIGFYLNTVVLTDSIEGEDTFKSVLSKVKSTVVDATRNHIYPYDMLVSELDKNREPGRNALFDIDVNMNRAVVDDAALVEDFNTQGLTMEGIDSSKEHNVNRFDLSISFDVAKETIVLINYNVDLYKKETIELMKVRFVNLIDIIIKDQTFLLKNLKIDRHIEMHQPQLKRSGIQEAF